MHFRLKAFGLHLLASASALTLVLAVLYLGWYRWPGWYLTGVLHVAAILVTVDVVLGPTLTLIVANPRKARREFARDVGIIVTVQLAALLYGTTTLWLGRPLYYTFSVDRLELVQASDLKPADILTGRRENPSLASHWYSRPQWIWAPLPENPDVAQRIVKGTLSGDPDVIQMPRYFRPWDQGLPQLRAKLESLEAMKSFSRREKQTLRQRMTQLGLAPDQPDTMVLWGGTRRLLAVFDPATLRLRAILRPD
ncbi:MAG TPA: hypothetical protein VEU54_02735 [Steroidobacteraceae bacterium]|nr:hypothetical protein [Steroidobacteraceae bacterium]